MKDFEKIEHKIRELIDQEQFDEAILKLELLEDKVHDMQFHLLLRHVAKNLGMKEPSPLDKAKNVIIK